MKFLNNFNAWMNRKGISVIVSYVILISIAIALSIMVYAWLRFYVEPGNSVQCPDSISLIIKDYSCVMDNGLHVGELDVSVQNKGLFNISGFTFKFSERDGAEIATQSGDLIWDGNPGDIDGIDVLNDGFGLSPGEEVVLNYSFNSYSVDDITLIQLQPFVEDSNGERVYCDRVASQSVVCE